MMATRQRLRNRRGSETFDFICGNFHYCATVSFFNDGRLAEIFIGNGKAGSATDTAAKDRRSSRAWHCSMALPST